MHSDLAASKYACPFSRLLKCTERVQAPSRWPLSAPWMITFQRSVFLRDFFLDSQPLLNELGSKLLGFALCRICSQQSASFFTPWFFSVCGERR